MTAGYAPRRPGSLRPRHRQVLRLLADGRQQQEIAKELYLSEHTVRYHLRGVYRALDARNNAHAVSLGYQWGFLTPDPSAVARAVLREPEGGDRT